MAQRFDIKYNNFLKSLNGIQDTIDNNDKLSTNDKKAILYDFGGLEEQTWKLFKYYLEYIAGYENLGNASKNVYRESLKVGLISAEQCELLLETIDLRNVLFHEYNYEEIEESCNKILKYLDLFKDVKTVFDNIKQEYNEEFEKDIINI